MKAFLSLVASVLAALAASACCWIPALLGAGAVGSFAFTGVLSQWRPYLLALTFLLLGVGFLLALRPVGDCCLTEEGRAEQRRKRKATLWTLGVVSVLVIAISAYPNLLALQGGGHSAPAFSGEGEYREYVVRVRGMDCAGCAPVLSKHLEGLPGVASAEVDYDAGLARVRVSSPSVQVGDIVSRIKETGYEAEPLPESVAVSGGEE